MRSLRIGGQGALEQNKRGIRVKFLLILATCDLGHFNEFSYYTLKNTKARCRICKYITLVEVGCVRISN